MTLEEISKEYGIHIGDLEAYTALKRLNDGRLVGIMPLMFHWTLHVDINPFGYADKYCFATRDMAETAIVEWDGHGDPGNQWHRHIGTGRRRNLETGEEWIAF